MVVSVPLRVSGGLRFSVGLRVSGGIRFSVGLRVSGGLRFPVGFRVSGGLRFSVGLRVSAAAGRNFVSAIIPSRSPPDFLNYDSNLFIGPLFSSQKIYKSLPILSQFSFEK
jgi:hypothetical protein